MIEPQIFYFSLDSQKMEDQVTISLDDEEEEVSLLHKKEQ